MNRGEIYRTSGKLPGFYVVVSRSFVARNEEIATVMAAPIYGELIGLATEVAVGRDEGLPHPSAIRCDFVSLLLRQKLAGFVSTLSASKLRELDRALSIALDLPIPR